MDASFSSRIKIVGERKKKKLGREKKEKGICRCGSVRVGRKKLIFLSFQCFELGTKIVP